MTENQGPARTLWAYVYEIIPPQDEDRFREITTLLDHENSEAQNASRTWTGRFVLEQRVARILVVSDTPEQNRAINDRLEDKLKVLGAAFAMSVPMAVVGVAAQPLTDESE